MNNDSNKISTARLAWGILSIFFCVFVSLSLFSYEWRDISVLYAGPVTEAGPANLIGPIGAWMAFLLFMSVGVGAFAIPAWFLGLGLILVFYRKEKTWPRVLLSLIVLFALISIMEIYPKLWVTLKERLNLGTDATGIYGRMLTRGLLVRYLGTVGTGIVAWGVFVIAFVILVEWRNIVRGCHYLLEVSRSTASRVNEFVADRKDRKEEIEEEQRQIEKKRRRLERELDENRRQKKEGADDEDEEEKEKPVKEKKVEPKPEKKPRAMMPDPEPEEEEEKPEPEPEPEPPKAEPEKERKVSLFARKPAPPPKEKEKPPAPEPVLGSSGTSNYTLPDISILDEPKQQNREIKNDTQRTAEIMIETLKEFGIEAEVKNVEQGPVVTRYELLPAAGVKVERISGLSNNLALSLKATSVRVQAPIPGKGLVGIEVPNATAMMVYLRELMEGDLWRAGKTRLPLVFGKDVGGNDLVADLATMPHLLIAGATGTGKTVCMNSVLAGLLMARTPDQLKLILVDPKIVEFSFYNGMPHLLAPVVTDPKKVSFCLRKAIDIMEKRYKMFAKVGVRNIESFNNREVAKQGSLFADVPVEAPKEEAIPDRVPYIVIVIDELADLMLTAAAEIENYIARLAQLSRAVGIHMIISTQRPSVNVITGTIKANFPARVAFQVAQKTDSRTILDSVGADKLLGRGDMLFLPPGASKLLRAQGAMTTDEEIRRIADFWKKQGEPSYDAELQEKLEKPASASKLDTGEDDELLEQSIQIIRETRRASTSSLQRRLRIGYTRAARLMDIMEERGIVGPPRGSDAREILIDLDSEPVPADADMPAAAGPAPEEEEKTV